MSSCSPQYEHVDIVDLEQNPTQYTNRNIEVEGGSSSGFLNYQLRYKGSSVKLDKGINIMGPYDSKINKIVLRGKFNKNKVLEVRSGFVDIDTGGNRILSKKRIEF